MIELNKMAFSDHIVKVSGVAPFSFIYDGKSSKDILKNWKIDQRTETIDDNRTKNIVTYTDPATGLEIQCEAIVYSDYPAVEWVIYFTNTSKADTPIIQDIQAIDALITADTLEPIILHHSQGSLCNDTDFLPYDDSISKGEKKTLTTSGGRSSQNSLPFYNIQLGSEGLIVAIGWSGQWISSIERLDDGINIKAGMELTYLKLHPGESIR